jgi:hypothetical protein
MGRRRPLERSRSHLASVQSVDRGLKGEKRKNQPDFVALERFICAGAARGRQVRGWILSSCKKGLGMAREFSVPSHTTFFNGYLDAVGRHYSDESRLCAISAAIMPAESLQHLATVGTTPVENMVTEFASDSARFLGTDPRNRLVFYLIEYFDWFKQFSDNCVCERVRLSGDGFPDDHIAYRLFIDETHEVLFLGYWKDKGAMPISRLERSRVASSVSQGGRG